MRASKLLVHTDIFFPSSYTNQTGPNFGRAMNEDGMLNLWEGYFKEQLTPLTLQHWPKPMTFFKHVLCSLGQNVRANSGIFTPPNLGFMADQLCMVACMGTKQLLPSCYIDLKWRICVLTVLSDENCRITKVKNRTYDVIHVWLVHGRSQCTIQALGLWGLR